jgi:hypothetical protein
MVLAIIVIALSSSCMSKETIKSTVVSSMQTKFDSDNTFKQYSFKVSDLSVISKGGNMYQGLATIQYKDEPHDVAVEITVDGDSVMWQVAPGALLSVLQ